MISGDELQLAISKKDALIKEIKELKILLSYPSSILITRSETSRQLEESFWKTHDKLKECHRVANFSESTRSLCSFNQNLLNEVRQMVADWRAEAYAEVAQMTAAERQSYLVQLGYADAETGLGFGKSAARDVLSQPQPGPRPRGRPKGSVTVKRRTGSSGGESSTSRFTSQSATQGRTADRSGAFGFSLAVRKRKSTMIPRADGAKVSKHARLAGGTHAYSKSDALKRKHASEWSLPLKINVTQSDGFRGEQDDVEEEEDGEVDDAEISVSSDGRDSKSNRGWNTTGFRSADREADEGENEFDEDDEEDQLTAIVRRQREAFSARVAAGRPSIRNQAKTSNPSDLSHPLSGASSASIARVLQTNKVLREWKMLARKVLCKVARQCLATRREKISLAKRAARECARVVRQRALLSHKAGKDAASRGHRLCREIATNWRNSAQSMASGNGPLTVNGITFPVSTDSAGSSEVLRQPDYHNYGISVKGEAPGVTTGPDGNTVESAAAARRRAERAAAEQRRADLELLEARRQQRKLNFLITQTELYAHFMARKLDATVVTPDETTQNSSAPPEKKVDDSVEWTTDRETAETTRILRRLEESDEELEEQVAEESRDLAIPSDNQSPAARDPVNKSPVRLTKSPGSSSIAVAAKAAATRLGIKIEDEYDIQRIKSEAMSRVRLAVERERDRRSQVQNLMPIPISPVVNRQPRPTDPTASETTVQSPHLFHGSLKAYQLQGLNWLLGLFDQGINGILADEMGLGKTIQTIAFLGYLAETYGLWGPFLIVSPASTLHNWTQEFTRFLPAFRIVPYWGNPAERKVLRRFWFSARQSGSVSGTGGAHEPDDDGPSTDYTTPGQPGTREAEMHVVITSYQVVLQDAKFINKTAWSYIVLDEAHAIKSTSSLRWRILLSFKCRNRLLLTGTPIQNTMQELWALLHFIMPTLFDSHDEFANWFSRDIESQATQATTGSTSGGTGLSTSKLNENQLSRLHLILKPFMLRRTKTEVEHEISKKTEILRYCPLSHRQQILYSRLRNKIRLEDLSSVIGSADQLSSGSNEAVPFNATAATATHLINLVMQLRKVCNHPDLWEPRDVRFSCFHGAFLPTEHERTGASRTRDHDLWLPRLLYDQGLLPGLSWTHTGTRTRLVGVNLPAWPVASLTYMSADQLALLARWFSIFHPAHVHADLWHHDDLEPDLGPESTEKQATLIGPMNSTYPSKCFSFSRLLRFSVQELCLIACTGLDAVISPRSTIVLHTQSNTTGHHQSPDNGLQPLIRGPSTESLLPPDVFHSIHPAFLIIRVPDVHSGEPVSIPLSGWTTEDLTNTPVDQDCSRFDIPRRYLTLAVVDKVSIQPVGLHVRAPRFTQHYTELLSLNRPVFCEWNEESTGSTTSVRGLPRPVCVPNVSRKLELISLATRISDSGKLAALDALLNELKPAGHRVLIYSQMTRMIDILEEFMLYRNHAYLRLDGSSRLSDRRDMVAQWQTNPRWFVFLLSTRAGGLGINLTAADTVIFYDSDWNPTVDQQAMDRAHRLGQTKPVTVYRLVCKNTIEGRMMQRAEEKRAMQQMVIQSDQEGNHQTGNLIPTTTRSQEQLTSSDMVSLLLDDDELVTRLQQRRRTQMPRGRPSKSASAPRLSSVGNGTAGAVENESTSGSLVPSNATLENTGSPMLVDTALARKRQALWAEMPRVPMGRPKKIRPIESIGSAASVAAAAAFAASSSSSNNNNNNNNNTGSF
ncbi:INO80 [Fasciola hepatica]|uniref:Chromatin-remodeling ATPase INO80 n=1 Tax=Fasciola hepatica TaxID=6192 RepID=A0A4E0RFR6_FASHE|nr:INO80 [Fasciola hepatica]